MGTNANSWGAFWKELPNLVFWVSLLFFAVLIIITFLIFESSLQQFITTLTESYGQQSRYFWIMPIFLILLLVFDVALPVPSTVVALVAATSFGFFGGSVVIFIGLTGGAILGYFLGAGYIRIISSSVIHKNKESARNVADKLGIAALICFRGVPVLAEISVIAAGIRRYPFRKFLLIVSLANAGLALAYGYIGAFLSGKESLLLVVLASLCLPLLLFSFRTFIK